EDHRLLQRRRHLLADAPPVGLAFQNLSGGAQIRSNRRPAEGPRRVEVEVAGARNAQRARKRSRERAFGNGRVSHAEGWGAEETFLHLREDALQRPHGGREPSRSHLRCTAGDRSETEHVETKPRIRTHEIHGRGTRGTCPTPGNTNGLRWELTSGGRRTLRRARIRSQ